MHRPTDDSGFLSRLLNDEALRRISGGRPLLIVLAAPATALIAITLMIATLAVQTSGNSAPQSVVEEPTSTPTAGLGSGEKTPIAFSEGSQLTLADLALRGAGEPGRGEFTAQRLIIPRIGVDAPFTQEVVGTDGNMPDPEGPDEVAYYDFSSWPGLGGLPGVGGNVILAGHVDYVNVGPAVFWDIDTLGAGDVIQIRMQNGTLAEYRVEFNKWVDPADMDWTSIVSGTADESVTLITCTGEFSAGHYDKRQIVWGRRV